MTEQDFNKIFSKNLNRYLQLNEKTQLDLANYVGASASAVSAWCRGLKTPRMDKVDKMCDFFSIRRSDLMEDKSETLSDESAIISIKVAKSPELKRLIAYYEALNENAKKAIMDNIISIQSKGDDNSARILAYYNALSQKGKQRVLENAEDMLKLYPKEEEQQDE